MLSLFTLPIIVNFALFMFLGEGTVLPLEFERVLQVFAIVLVPVTIGMVIRRRSPARATKLEKPVRGLSALVLVLVIASAVIKERAHLFEYFGQVGPAALVFNLVSLAVGYLLPRLVRLPNRQAIAIAMEIGVHNGTLAIAIATSPLLLDSPRMAIPAAVYSLIMFFTAAGFGFLVGRREKPAVAPELTAPTK